MATTVPYDNMSTTSRSDSFTKCCFCIPIRTGCFILGYLSLIYNVFRTISILGITVLIGMSSTKDFDHIASPLGDYTDDEKYRILQQLKIIFVIVLLINFVWLIINIACLVGLHKKRPGPVRAYATFATIRLFLALLGFIYLVVNDKMSTSNATHHLLDISLSAYFVLVYYVYAMRLEREKLLTLPGPAPSVESINDNAFIYPKTLSEKHLIA